MMKRKEYMKKHAELLIKAAEQDNYMICLSDRNEELQELHTFSKDNKYGNYQPLTEKSLENALLNSFVKTDPWTFYQLQDKYIPLICQESHEHLEYFSKYSNSLIGSIRLNSLIQIQNKVPPQAYLFLVSQGGLNLGDFHHCYLKDFCKNLSTIKGSSQALLSYLDKREKLLSDIGVVLRDALVEYFPNELNLFKKFPYVEGAINIQQQQKKESFALDNNYEHTIYLRIDPEILINNYPVSGSTHTFYLETIKRFFEVCSSEQYFDICKYHMLESRKDKVYQYSHLYINSTKEIKKEDIVHLLEKFFTHVQTLENVSNIGNKDYIKTWLRKFLLEETLQDNSCSKSKMKI